MAPPAHMASVLSGRRHDVGYLAFPEGDGPFPGLVLIHEIYGLNESMKDIARRFAAQGYAALAVNLFADRPRAICMFRVMSGLLLNPLHNRGIRDLQAALTFLSEQPAVDASRVGAVGNCFGGSFVVAWACTDDRLQVIAPYYAMNPRPLKAVARLCPVVGSYPDKDITTPAGQKLDVELDRYQIPHDIKIYPGTKHGFFNDTSNVYDEQAAQDSWGRVLAFFEEHLVAKSDR